jgi:hypothetical protein
MGSNNHCKDYTEQLSSPKECFSNSTVARENKKTFEIKRISDKSEQFLRIQVDGCFIPDSKTAKCDFAFIRCKTGEVYFVELKGQDVNHAVDQIESTIDQFKAKISALKKEKISGFVVSSSVATKANIKFARRKKRFLDKYGIELRKESFMLIKRI